MTVNYQTNLSAAEVVSRAVKDLRLKGDESGFYVRECAPTIILLPLAARSGTVAGSAFTCEDSIRIVTVLMRVTSAGTGTLTVALQSQDPASGVWSTRGSTTLATTDTLKQLGSSGYMDRKVRALVTPSDGSTWTYAVSFIPNPR